jgi:hypothetical protein
VIYPSLTVVSNAGIWQLANNRAEAQGSEQREGLVSL